MQDTEPLRLVIVGHVDHGKSTLIGRLLYDTNSLPPEKMVEVRNASEALGHDVELAYVMDHLEEERTGAMTIDTAQAFFSTDIRDYAIIDAPGHKEFIKNMVTGASQAEAAVLMVDVNEGVREQTRRHAFFVAMLGIRQLTVVINKMDMVDFSQARFKAVSSQVMRLFDSLELRASHIIPGSAREGDNIVRRSNATPWYDGSTLAEALDHFRVEHAAAHKPFRFPVQDIYTLDGRQVIVGRVAAGRLECGQKIVFRPGNATAHLATVEVFGEDRTSTQAGECVGLTTDPPLARHRGEIACTADSLPIPVQRFTANVFWMSAQPCKAAETLSLRVATQEVPCIIERIEQRIDSASLSILEEDALELFDTEVGRMVLCAMRPLVLESFHNTPELGRLVLARGSDIVAGGIIGQTNEETV